jgi:hypothetical protein
MLTALAILIVLLMPVALLVAIAQALEARERARAEVVARQIMLTDAIHAELGPVVSPFVQKRAFRPWRVTFSVPETRVREMARLISITDRVLGAALPSSEGFHIVFTRPTPAVRALAA